MKTRFLASALLTFLIAASLSACRPTVAASATPSPIPSAIPATPTKFQPTIAVAGAAETVFDWGADRCADDEKPDAPARALRDADGRIELFISSTTNYRLTGATLDSLEPDCSPVLVSDMDRDPAHYNNSEWLTSVYTLDGNTIHAIVHNEYHGDQAGSIWQAGLDFSGEQNHNQWTYLSRSGSSYRPMNFDAANNRWQGTTQFCLIGDQWVHPDVRCQPVRAWTSPITGSVTISGAVFDQDVNCGNGVTAKISQGDQELWSATINNGDAQGQAFDLQVAVQEGDVVYFSVDAQGDSGCDTTYLNPGINLGAAPCPSGRHDMCTSINLTYAISTDKGKTFSQPEVPNHVLATVPYTYDADWMRALWQPSNIVKNPNDGFYYALIQRDEHSSNGSSNVSGMCVMRTQTLEEPGSWRAWDGAGFNMRFIDPYVDKEAKPLEHTCTLVTPENGALTYGLSYNTYFEKFIAVGVVPGAASGFYYALSDDLIHWTPKKLLMQAPFGDPGRFPFYSYPTLIDPASPSASFDVTGQNPYLYYSRFTNNDPWSIDLLRVPVKLNK